MATGTVLAFGCWDLLHVGHLLFLERARGHGDRLVVGVPLDRVVLEDKSTPPVIPCFERMRLVAALRCVDRVFTYGELNFVPSLEQHRPGVLVHGEDWGEAPRHRAAVEWAMRNGCRVVQIPRHPGQSTTIIKQKIREGP